MRHRSSTRRALGFALVLLPVAASVTPACQGKPGELCDVQCDCAPCNKREKKECVINGERDQDRAKAYGCESDYEQYIECAIDRNSCVDGSFRVDDSCNDDALDLNDCITNASDLSGVQASVGPGPDGPGPIGPGPISSSGIGGVGGVGGVGGSGGVAGGGGVAGSGAGGAGGN